MDNVVLQWLKDFNEAHGPFKYVLELGSLNVNGTARPAFWNAEEYVGIDMREGPAVDYVMHEDALREVFFDGFSDVHIDNPLWTPPPGHEHLRCQHMGGWGRM